MVGQQLQRHGGHQRGQQLLGAGDLDTEFGHVFHGGVAFGDHGNNGAFAGDDFLHVADNLVVGLLLGGHDDDGHVLINEGDGAVLHLGGGVAFRVDIRYLLQFQGPFQRDGIVDTAAQENGIGTGGHELGDFLDVLLFFEDHADFFRDGLQIVDESMILGLGDGAFLVGEAEGHEGEHGDLGGEGLRGGHADFGPGMGVGAGHGLAGQRRADHVADADDGGSVLFGQFNGGEGVGCLAGL